MRINLKVQIVVMTVQLLVASICVAEGPSTVDSSQLTNTSISFSFAGRALKKTIYCKSKTPGVTKRQSKGVLFTPYSYSVVKEKSRNARSTKLPLLRELLKRGKAACKSIPKATPRPTAPPQGTNPASTPTPQVTSAPTNFDAQGNLTSTGKALFGVPSSLSGNVSTGRAIHTSYCTGCHGEKINRSFSYIRTSIAASPMLYTSEDISDGQLAHLVAFLNRYRLQ